MKSPSVENRTDTTSTPVAWRAIGIYYALACGLLWVPFFGMVLAERGLGEPGVWGMVFGILGPYGPLMAALFVRSLVSHDGYADVRLSISGIHWQYWLIALALPLLWNLIHDGLQLVMGFATVELGGVLRGLLWVPVNIIGGLLIFIGEEFGWRSYLLEKLRPLGRFRALLLSGGGWALWHLPLLVVANPGTGEQVGLDGAVVMLMVYTLMGGIIGWLYLASGSVWPAVVMHATSDLIGLEMFRRAWQDIQEPTLLQSALFALIPILAIWLVLLWRGALAEPVVVTDQPAANES